MAINSRSTQNQILGSYVWVKYNDLMFYYTQNYLIACKQMSYSTLNY